MPGLIPRPLHIASLDGGVALDATTRISSVPDLLRTARWLAGAMRPATGFDLPVTTVDSPTPPRSGTMQPGPPRHPEITFALDATLGAEAFRLAASRDTVVITGGDEAGAFYGAHALLQLLPPEVFRRGHVAGVAWRIPAVRIEDAPRFSWRGAMLDVARHFIPKHDLLRYIDLFAAHRLNTLHLHLTDDQGWRVQILRYPRLTEVGSWRLESPRGPAPDAPGDGRPHGGFYSQDDLREIVGYAAERHIEVVPEIETPGHCLAALAAHPELGVGGVPRAVSTRWSVSPHILNAEESTIDFFCNVFTEIMDVFPSRFIGIGGDEAPKDEWRADPRTQALMRERGITSEERLQSWLVGRFARHIAARGRRVFGWDEILEGEPPASAAVASWRGSAGAAAASARGYDVISCPDDRVYLDYRQSDDPNEPTPFSIPLTLEHAYRFDPVPTGLPAEAARHVLGGQANVWTENMRTSRELDYMIFPRLCAIADALWRHGEPDFDAFLAAMEVHRRRLQAIGVEYRGDSGPQPWQLRPDAFGYPSDPEEHARLIADLTAGITADGTAPARVTG